MGDEIRWDIRREGRAWTGQEFHERYARAPKKLELIRGKLLWSDEQRLTLLGMLLENVGADRAVRLGDRNIWIASVEALRSPPRTTPFLRDPFNRWMLVLWSVNLVVIALLVFVVRCPDLPQPSASVASVVVSAVVAAATSLGVYAFLRE
jgi:hypothetical protein